MNHDLAMALATWRAVVDEQNERLGRHEVR